jgi:hypothetical protein
MLAHWRWQLEHGKPLRALWGLVSLGGEQPKGYVKGWSLAPRHMRKQQAAQWYPDQWEIVKFTPGPRKARMKLKPLCALALAGALFASHSAFAASDATCGSLDVARRLVLDGFDGSPLQELTPAQVRVARAVLLNPGSPEDARALAASRVLVSRIRTGDEAVIFADGDLACGFGFLPAGTLAIIDALKDRTVLIPGEGS